MGHRRHSRLPRRSPSASRSVVPLGPDRPTILSVERGFAESVTAGRGSTVWQRYLWESVEWVVSGATAPTTPERQRVPARRSASVAQRALRPRTRALVGASGAILGLLASRRARQALPVGTGRPGVLEERPARALPQG